MSRLESKFFFDVIRLESKFLFDVNRLESKSWPGMSFADSSVSQSFSP